MNDLIHNFKRVYTSEKTENRIRYECRLPLTTDVTKWTQNIIKDKSAQFKTDKGNWYVNNGKYQVTIRCDTYCVISAKKTNLI